MANTRGATHIHGPSATGTIKAGNVTPSSAAPITVGSGANSGKTTLIAPGSKAPNSGRSGNPISGGAKGVSAGMKTTVGDGSKASIVTSGKGVGSDTPYKRKTSRKLGTGGQRPA
jgi:hypothetical protein